MSSPLPSTPTEVARHASLARYGILDTAREQAYDDLAALAAYICKAPVAAITFFDGERQWFKSSVGTEIAEAPMEFSFCTYVSEDPDYTFVVEDASQDARFAEAPHVVGGPQIRAYAGSAVVSPEGVPVGTICVFDVAPRGFDAEQIGALKSLSRQIVTQLELRKRVGELEATTAELRAINDDLDQFGYIVSHDLRAPIRQQSAFAQLLLEDYAEMPDEMRSLLLQCRLAGRRAAEVLDDIDTYLHTGSLNVEDVAKVDLATVIASVPALLVVPPKVTITYDLDALATEVKVPVAPVRHVLANLISNAIKYNDKPSPEIHVLAKASSQKLQLYVQDNGPGILDHDRGRIFQIFGRGSTAGDEEGRGLGLAICVKLLRSLHGQLTVENRPEGGAVFCASFPL